jgi:hypothetical protein
MNQDLMIDGYVKREVETYEPKMFSGYFQNIRELQRFLFFSRHFSGSTATISLGLAHGAWKEFKGGTYATNS